MGHGRCGCRCPKARSAERRWKISSGSAPDVAVEIADRAGPGARAAPRLTTRDTLRATAKASDGPVSRWLNRPVSRLISALLLRLPGIRPIHATLGTVILAAAMFAALLIGGEAGLIAGGLLFHAASVFDGVDGEIARATFRTSRAGAVLDRVVDVATNFLFILGVTVGSRCARPAGAAGRRLGAGAVPPGVGRDQLVGRARRPAVQHGGRQAALSRQLSGTAYARLIGFLTIVTSRDFFALLFALLILAGVPMAILYIFAAARPSGSCSSWAA